MTTPRCENLRYGEVLDWLESFMPRSTARYLIEDGVIKGFQIGRRRKKLYSRSQIQRDVLDKLNPAEGPASEEKVKVESRK